jgi:glycosyltransferase involved in cell wall biosynthesis
LVFADDWGSHPSSAQHLFRRFLAINRVVWFNSVGLRLPRATFYDLRKIFQKIRHWSGHSAMGLTPRGRKPFTHEAGICEPMPSCPRPEIHDIPLLPLQLGRVARKANAWILRRAVRKCLAKAQTQLSPFIVSTLPLTADLVGEIPGATFIYYLVDDYASWPGLTGEMVRQMDREQARAADRIVAASRALADLHPEIAHRADYLPHGVDVEHFGVGRRVRAQRKQDGIKPIADVIFFGALDERIDQELLNAVIRARPGLRFLCIGPRTGSKDRLAPAPNLERRPAVPFADLPTLLGSCEVALLPYVQGNLGKRLAPLKALEALTVGLPIVATDIPELRALHTGVFLGKTLPDMLSCLDQASNNGANVPSLQDLAAESWENRAERLSAILLSARAAST